MEKIKGIIKAMTAYGGEDYPAFEEHWNDENIALFQQWLKEQPKVSGLTLYRGYTFDRSYFNDAMIEAGRIIGVDQLTQEQLPSFTTDYMRAARYVNEFGEVCLSDTVRVLFIIRAHGKAFVDISSLSHYPEEHEFKCTDDVNLYVERVRHTSSFTEIYLSEVLEF